MGSMANGESTSTLVERARAGDREAFEELTRRFGPRLEEQIRSRMGDAAKAKLEPEDVLNETFTCALESIPTPTTTRHGRYLLDVDASLSDDRIVDLGDLETPRGRSIEGIAENEQGVPLVATVTNVVLHAHEIPLDRSVTLRVVGPDGEPIPDVPIQLDRGFPAYGRLIGPDGKPVAGAEIIVRRGDSTEVARRQSSKAGRFLFYLSSGPSYTIDARHTDEGRAEWRGRVTVTHAAVKRLELRMSPE